MAGICQTSFRKNGPTCDHRSLSFLLDGVTVDLEITQGEIDDIPWDAENRKKFLILAARRQRALGLVLDDAIGRVFAGDEATNVKEYVFFGPGLAITKTNIGTAYVNILPGLNGERILVDFTGCSAFRPVLTANLVGTGPFGVRIIKDSDNTVLYENANIALTGERELDPGWQSPIPAGFTGLEILRIQAKSVTAADDPIFRRATLLIR